MSRTKVCDDIMFDLVAEVAAASPSRTTDNLDEVLARFQRSSQSILRRAQENDCIESGQQMTIEQDAVRAIEADFKGGMDSSQRADLTMSILEEYLD
jgi:hypothetical protein